MIYINFQYFTVHHECTTACYCVAVITYLKCLLKSITKTPKNQLLEPSSCTNFVIMWFSLHQIISCTRVLFLNNRVLMIWLRSLQPRIFAMLLQISQKCLYSSVYDILVLQRNWMWEYLLECLLLYLITLCSSPRRPFFIRMTQLTTLIYLEL